jgi:hypothetical protein
MHDKFPHRLTPADLFSGAFEALKHGAARWPLR